MDYLNNISLPKCYNCKASLNFSYNKNNTVSISCRCTIHLIPLSSYYSIVNTDRPLICNLHYNNSIYYCLNCLSFLCSQCLKTHISNTHYILTLRKEAVPSLYCLKTLYYGLLYQKCLKLYKLSDGRLSVNEGRYITINNPDNFKISDSCLVDIEEKTKSIFTFIEIKNKILVISYCDGHLVYYSLSSRKYIKRLYQQCIVRTTGLLLCEIDDDKFAATGEDGKIYIISTEKPFDILYILEGHESKVTSMLQLNNDKLMTSPKISFDNSDGNNECEKTIRIWNLSLKNCFRIIQNIECINMFKFNSKIVLVSGYHKITLMNITTLSVDGVIEDEKLKDLNITCLLRFNEEDILIGCTTKKGQSCLGIADIKNKNVKEIRTDFNPRNLKYMIYLNEKVIVFAGEEIKIASIT